MDNNLNAGRRRQLVGVFNNEDDARAAARATGAGGQVGATTDRVNSLKAEMRDELDNSFIGAGNVGPFTKEMSKGISVATPVFTLLGAVLGLAIAFIGWGSIGLAPRLVIGALVGAAAGATAGFVIGGGFGAKSPAQPMAAERGVTVAVDVTDRAEATRLADRMRAYRPIRIDLVAEGEPKETLTTEEDELRRLRHS
jgi:hypothetical protein